jgi:hypothetical protein
VESDLVRYEVVAVFRERRTKRVIRITRGDMPEERIGASPEQFPEDPVHFLIHIADQHWSS